MHSLIARSLSDSNHGWVLEEKVDPRADLAQSRMDSAVACGLEALPCDVGRDDVSIGHAVEPVRFRFHM